MEMNLIIRIGLSFRMASNMRNANVNLIVLVQLPQYLYLKRVIPFPGCLKSLVFILLDYCPTAAGA
jgi:hypothetical protein